MANWTGISRNLKRNGHFAGHSEIEQDAYFEFFAGSDRSYLKTIRVLLRKTLRHVTGRPDERSLHGMPPRLAYPRVNNGTWV